MTPERVYMSSINMIASKHTFTDDARDSEWRSYRQVKVTAEIHIKSQSRGQIFRLLEFVLQGLQGYL